jgi:DUF971 family protein
VSKEDYTPEQVTPTDIKVRQAERRVVISWRDGHVSSLDFTMLRRKCPCATCVAERTKEAGSQELFPILKKDPGTGAPTVMGVHLVGNYAVHFQWSDGHETGIYDYRYLRSLDAGESGA